MPFEQFEKEIKDSEKEGFERWGDYMEWKGKGKIMSYLRENLNKKEGLS